MSNGGAADRNMQQATINLFADMGAQPGYNSKSTHHCHSINRYYTTCYNNYITGQWTQIPESATFNITGTATDVGGVVAGVEVSVDGGLTWQPATGTTNWSFSWLPTAQGTVTIKSRAFDDIGNLESPGGSEGSANTVTVTVVAGTPPTNCPCSILYSTCAESDQQNDLNQNDGQGGITVGVKFKADFDGNNYRNQIL